MSDDPIHWRLRRSQRVVSDAVAQVWVWHHDRRDDLFHAVMDGWLNGGEIVFLDLVDTGTAELAEIALTANSDLGQNS